uniref:Uncharacterized protein n=1 Tax=Panagrolaimus sp. ES5 TaxID=591445 RepID=A0AC34FVS1_9BILA
MSLGAALTEYVKTEKLFTWVIANVDLITAKNLKKAKDNQSEWPKFLKSLEMTAVDPNTDVEYTATLKLKFYEFPGSAYNGAPKRCVNKKRRMEQILITF